MADSCGAGTCRNTGDCVNWIECERCQVWFHFKCIGWRDEAKKIENYVFICRQCRSKETAIDARDLLENGLSKLREEIDCIKNEINQSNGCGFASSSIRSTPNNTRDVEFLGQIISDDIQNDTNIANETIILNSKKNNEINLYFINLLPEFTGKSYEDPEKFLSNCELILKYYGVNQRQWCWIIMKKLKGQSYFWSRLINFDIKYVDFKSKFISRFKDKSILSKIHVDFYGTKQSEVNDSEIFITEKLLMYRRLFPDSKDDEAVANIVHLLHPKIKSQLLAHFPTNIDQLITKACLIQTNDFIST